MGKPDPKYYTAFKKYLREGKVNEQLDSATIKYIESLISDIRANGIDQYPPGFDFETDFRDFMGTDVEGFD